MNKTSPALSVTGGEGSWFTLDGLLITGRGVQGQWPRIAPLMAMAIGMLLVLVGEFWMLELIA